MPYHSLLATMNLASNTIQMREKRARKRDREESEKEAKGETERLNLMHLQVII